MGVKHSKATKIATKLKQLRAETALLRAELVKAKEEMSAIQSGAVDALVVNTPEGQRIFTLHGAEKSYRALVEQMREGAVRLRADGTIDYCNRGFADMIGHPLEQVIGTLARRYIVHGDQPAFESLLRLGLTGSVQGSLGFLAADGRVVPAQVGLSLLLDNSTETSVSMVVINLTERKRAEHVLAGAQFTRRLIASAPIGVAVVGKDLRYILANAAHQSITGDSPADVVGRTLAQVLPPTVAQVIEPAVVRVLQGGEGLGFHQFEAQVRGHTWWNVNEVPLHDAAGKIEAVLLLTEEVTERKRVEEELKTAKRSAEEATATAEAASKAKDHFMAVLGHELRNPLNPVLATASLLREEPRFDADTREQLDVICRNAELAARLIDDLLDVTRIRRGKVELDRKHLDLSTIIRRAVDDCMPDLKVRKLEFGLDLGTEPFWVDADAGRLQQVFWNLLKNSIKFTPVGGSMGIRCRRDGEGFVAAEISDSGEGIEAEAMGRIFDAFDQGERAITRQFGGLGLGLTISKAIVSMHGGSIHADSEGKGKGATFTVKLPLLAVQGEAAAAPPVSQTTPPVAATRPLRILLVEDHGDTAQIMRRLLTAQHHEVEIAADVASALKLAGHQTFDVLLSDLGLPDGSGLDLMRALRAGGSKLPGIALSGYGQAEDIEQTREAGFFAHLVKPVNLPKLKEAIAQAAGSGIRTSKE